jgi:hypothetical protein
MVAYLESVDILMVLAVAVLPLGLDECLDVADHVHFLADDEEHEPAVEEGHECPL